MLRFLLQKKKYIVIRIINLPGQIFSILQICHFVIIALFRMFKIQNQPVGFFHIILL